MGPCERDISHYGYVFVPIVICIPHSRQSYIMKLALYSLGFIENCSYCVTECSLTSQPWLSINVVTALKIDIDDITQTFNFLLKVKVISCKDSTIIKSAQTVHYLLILW